MDDKHLIGSTASTRIYWHDADKTILIHEVVGKWTWDEAYNSITLVNSTISQHPKQVATIHWFRPAASVIPKGNELSNLRRMMVEDPPNEELVIFVGASTLVKIFLQTIIRAYQLTGLESKYHYVRHLDEALVKVEEHRKRTPTPA